MAKGKKAEGPLVMVVKYVMGMQTKLSFIMFLLILCSLWIFLNVGAIDKVL